MTADPVTIRAATAADAASIASVLADAFVEFRDLYTPDGYRATAPAHDEVERRLADGPIWVAEIGGQVTGTVSAVVREDGVYVRGMAVGRSARGAGIGKRLLKQVHEFAAAQDRSHLYLSTTPFLSTAIQLYQRAGFIPTSAPPYELHGTPLFTMEKWSKGVDVR